MKLLFVNDHYIPQVYRGTEVNTHSLCLLLKNIGHDVAVLSGLKPNGMLGLWSRSKLKILPNKGWVLDRVPGYEIYRTWYVPSVLDDVVRRVKPDIVVLQSSDSDILSSVLQLSIPIIHYFHIIPLQDSMTVPVRVGHVTNSLFCQERILERYNIPSKVIRPIIQPEHYKIEVSRVEITAFGMSSDKGADVVLELAARLPNLPFRVFANQYSASAKNLSYFQRAALLPNVTITKPIRSGGKIYQRTRVVLTPSRWEETWGRIATEAHVNEIPVLASARGGLPEAVGVGGLCLPFGSPIEAWVDALSEMFSDETAYNRYQAGARVQRENLLLSPNRIRDDFVRVAEGVVTQTV